MMPVHALSTCPVHEVAALGEFTPLVALKLHPSCSAVQSRGCGRLMGVSDEEHECDNSRECHESQDHSFAGVHGVTSGNGRALVS